MPTAADIDWEVLPDAIPSEARTPEPTETPSRRTAGDIDWEVLPDDTARSPSFGSELVAGATAPFKALAGSRKLITNSDDELKTLLLREFAKQRSTTGGGALSKAGRVIGGIAGGVGEFAAAEAAGTTLAAETGPAAPFIGLGAASAAFGASGAYESFISAGTRALAEGKSADDALRIGKQVAKIGALTGAATAVALPGGVSGALERSAARRLASGKALAETLAPLTAAELKRQGEGAALRVGKMAAGGAAVGAGGQVVENLAEKEAGLDVSPLEGVVEQALIMGGLPVLLHAKALWKQAREVKATDPKKAEALQKTADDIATTELEKVDTKEEVPPVATAEATQPTLTKEQVAANAVKRRVRQWQEQRRAEIKAARPEVPESGEGATGKSVIDEVRDNELFTRKDVQEHFRRTGARVPSNEEAADFLKRAWNRTQGETDTVDALINADESPAIRTAEEQRVLDEQRQREQQGQAEPEAITPKAAPENDTRSEVERRIIERHRVEAQSDFDAAVSSGNKAEIRKAQKRLMRIQQVLQAPPAPAKGPIQPKAPLQNVPRSTFKPAVPESEPESERSISVVDEIKANNARTIAEIQRLFPQAQLNRESARKLRDQAWGVAPKAPESAKAAVATETPKATAAPVKAEALTPEQQAEERAQLEEEFSSDETDAKEPPPSVQPTEAPSQSSETPVAASASDEVVSGPPAPEPQPTNESEPTTPFPQAQTGVKTPSLTADGPSGDWSYETLKGLTLSQRAKLAGDLRRYTKDARLTDKEGMLEVGPKKIADVARDSIETKRKIAEAKAAKPAEAAPPESVTPSVTDAAPSKTADNPTVEVPVSQLSLSEDIPQFKAGANERGVIRPLGGSYERVGTSPIQVWRRKNGKLEVISGRHRFDLAQRTGEKTIPAQIHDEAIGFDAQAAARLDADINIRDEQGGVGDYASYFKHSGISKEEADAKGLLASGKGKAGFSIAQSAGDDLFALHQAGRIGDAQAEAIAEAAPKDPALQAVGIKAALDGKSAETASDLIKLAKDRVAIRKAKGQQTDLFGFDDSAIREMEAQARLASEERRGLREQISSVKGAAKKPEVARKLGVDVQDPEGVQKKVNELEARLDLLKAHPELAGEVAKEEVPAEAPAPAPKASVKPTASGELFAASDTPFNLVSDKTEYVKPKVETTGYGNQTLSQNELFGIQKVVESKDPAKSADAAQKLYGGPKAAADKIEAQLKVVDSDPTTKKAFVKEQRDRLRDVLALLRQRANSESKLTAASSGNYESLSHDKLRTKPWNERTGDEKRFEIAWSASAELFPEVFQTKSGSARAALRLKRTIEIAKWLEKYPEQDLGQWATVTAVDKWYQDHPPVTQPSPETISKYRIGNNPQTHTLLERLPQSESEKANGEQPVRVKNDKTGKEETVMESDLTPVKERSAEEKAAAKSAKRDLDAELEAAKLDPSVFTSDAEKRAALDRAKAKGKFAAPGEGGHTVEGARAEAEKAFGKLSDRISFIHDPEADFGAHIDSDGRITVNAAKVAPGTVERVLLEEGLHGVWQHPEVQEAWQKFRDAVEPEDVFAERVLREQHELPVDEATLREEAAISKLLNEPEAPLAKLIWDSIVRGFQRLFGMKVTPDERQTLLNTAVNFLRNGPDESQSFIKDLVEKYPRPVKGQEGYTQELDVRPIQEIAKFYGKDWRRGLAAYMKASEDARNNPDRFARPTIPAHGPVPPEVSKIKRLADKIGDSLTKARATAAHLWNSSRVREAIAYTRDVVGTKANLFGRQMANEIRRPLRKTFGGDKRAEDALAFAVEAKGDRTALDNFRSQILNSTAASDHWKSKAVGAIDFAIHHWDALQPHVERYNDITRHQVLGREHPAGIETLIRNGYVMHEQDIDDSPAGYSGTTSSSGSGTGFRKNREHNTFADSIAAGVDPKSINAVDLLQKRIVRGETLINTRSWSESLRSVVDPQTKKPIADTPAVVTRADGSTYLQPPDGYTLEHIGFQPVAIHKGYEGLIRAVTDPSWFSQSLGKRSIMKAAQAGKAISLAFDTFHLGRVAFWDSLIKGTGIRTFKLPFPSYRKGLTLLDYTDAQIRDMAASGEIPNHWVASLTQDKARLNHLVKGGYNVGRISDALYQDLLHGLPIIGKLNRWIFDSFQRGAMAETGLLEFERAKLGNPSLSDADIGRMVAKDLNTRFGQMGRQGLLKSGTGQDLARLLVLAPQWNEGLIRSELGAVKQGGQFLSNLARGRGVYTGVLLRSVGGMAVAQFAANQIINMITRGHPTWENPEEGLGAKLSAWIPDKVGGGSGFFLHPLGLAAETTHLLMSKFEKTKDFHASLMAYGRSRASTAMRPVMTFITNEDFLGRKLKPGTVWGEMTKSAIPVPIGAPAYAGVAKQIVTGKESESFPGQFQKQIMSSVGIKTDSAPAPASRVATLAREFNRQKGIVPSAEFYTGDYQPLSAALAVGNTKDAQSALEELKKHKTTEQIQKHFRQWVNHPFTGQKGRESQFRMTLTPEQRDQYRQALDQRKKIAANVLKLLRDTKP